MRKGKANQPQPSRKLRRRPWTTKEIQTLQRLYYSTTAKEISRQLDRSVRGIYQMANWIGLRKDPSIQQQNGLCAAATPRSIRHHFQKGNVPHNKGLRRPGYAPGRMAETQFKPGNHPHTWKPIGSTRFSKEGYLERKISDTGYPPHDWVGEHRLLWEKKHGPVPKGFIVTFKDHDKTHIRLNNLELISRVELMRRNSIHNLPKPLADVIQLAGALHRQLRKYDEK